MFENVTFSICIPLIYVYPIIPLNIKALAVVINIFLNIILLNVTGPEFTRLSIEPALNERSEKVKLFIVTEPVLKI